MEQDFMDQYKAASNVDLLLILHKAYQYQDDAVEAVRQILQSRTVTTDDRIQAQAIIDQETAQRQIKQQNTNRLKSSVARFAGNIISTSERSDRQKVQLFCWGLTFLFVFQLFRNSQFIVYYFTHISEAYYADYYDTLVLLPFLLLPVGIYKLYKRQKWGWTIVAILFAISTLENALMFIKTLLSPREGCIILFESPPAYSILLSLLIHGGVLYYLNSLKFIRLFPVTRKWQITTLIATFFYTICLFFITMW